MWAILKGGKVRVDKQYISQNQQGWV